MSVYISLRGRVKHLHQGKCGSQSKGYRLCPLVAPNWAGLSVYTGIQQSMICAMGASVLDIQITQNVQTCLAITQPSIYFFKLPILTTQLYSACSDHLITFSQFLVLDMQCRSHLITSSQFLILATQCRDHLITSSQFLILAM